MVLAPAELRNANRCIMIMICNDPKIRHSYDLRHQRYLGSSIVYRTISLTGIVFGPISGFTSLFSFDVPQCHNRVLLVVVHAIG